MTKFEIIRDIDEGVDGYKLGEWFLMKVYYWKNDYYWLVTKKRWFSDFDIPKMKASGEAFSVKSCKDGKAMLIELNK